MTTEKDECIPLGASSSLTVHQYQLEGATTLEPNEPGNSVPSNRVAKSGAERQRAYMQRKKRLNNIMVTQHDASMPLPSLTMLQDVTIPSASSTSVKTHHDVLSTTPFYVAAPQITGISKLNAKKTRHLWHEAMKGYLEQRPYGKSSTERVREFRMRKAAISFMENVMLKSATTGTSTETQHNVTFAAPQKNRVAKSNAERQRDYRRRKAAKRRLEQRARVGKSSTERVREFRLRKAAVSLLKSNTLRTTTSSSLTVQNTGVVTPVTQKQCEYIEHVSVKEVFTQTTHLHLQSDHETIPLTASASLPMLQDVPISSKTSTSMELQHSVTSSCASTLAAPQTTRVPKSNAERQRDYRRRKAMEKRSEKTAQNQHGYTEHEHESVEEESTRSGLLQREWGQLSGFLQDRQHETMPLMTGTSLPILQDVPIPSATSPTMEIQHNVVSTFASSVDAPQTTRVAKSNAERQRDYRRRKAAARRSMRTHSAVQTTVQ